MMGDGAYRGTHGTGTTLDHGPAYHPSAGQRGNGQGD